MSLPKQIAFRHTNAALPPGATGGSFEPPVSLTRTGERSPSPVAPRAHCTARITELSRAPGYQGCRLYTIRSVIGAEGEPSGGEVGHSAEADPERLGAGWKFGGSVVVAAQLGQ